MKRVTMMIAFVFALAANTAFAHVGLVYEMQGSMSITRGDDTIRAYVGMHLEKGDTLKTTKTSRLIVQMHDGAMLTIAPASEISVAEFTAHTKEAPGNTVLETAKGFFRYVSGRTKRSVSFKTPVGAIGIRGTDVFWEVKGDGVTVVGLVQCCVDVTSKGGTVALETPNTFSKITSADEAPTAPEPCNPEWLQKVKAALGANDAFFKAIK